MKIKKVYFPDYEITDIQTFKKPMDNTVYYEHKTCNLEVLEEFLSSIKLELFDNIYYFSIYNFIKQKSISDIVGQQIIKDDNDITKIINLPSSLKILSCGCNPIDKLSVLPIGMTILNCAYTNLSNFDYLPYGLWRLECDGTPVTSLDNLTPNIGMLIARNLNLIHLFDIPPSVEDLYIDECYVEHVKQNMPPYLTFLNEELVRELTDCSDYED